MKRIKVFLGGYVNSLNAQNINCRALSEHLNKNKYEVATMLTYNPNAADFKQVDGVKYIMATKPMRIFRWLTYLKGICWADVAYLPKGECDSFCHLMAKLFGTKVFTTLEGVLDEILLSKLSNAKAYVDHFRKYEPHLYSITKYIVTRESIEKKFHFASEILYLGVDTQEFLHTHNEYDCLKNIVFIGNDLVRKNCMEFIEVSRLYPDIIFHILGGDNLPTGNIKDYLRQEQLDNVVYHGQLNHTQMARLLADMDLMFFPSRSEGFPKVMLETACAGVPTLCYSDYGAEEWITTGKDGYVVRTKEEALAVINDLRANPEKLKDLSRNAVELGKRFDWSVMVKVWENVIEKIYIEK